MIVACACVATSSDVKRSNIVCMVLLQTLHVVSNTPFCIICKLGGGQKNTLVQNPSTEYLATEIAYPNKPPS